MNWPRDVLISTYVDVILFPFVYFTSSDGTESASGSSMQLSGLENR